MRLRPVRLAVVLGLLLGDVFYTKGVNTGKVALVATYTCAPCRRVYSRSAADKVADNNLDSIRPCSGSS